MPLNIQEMLKELIDQGGSDLHITTGAPPQMRISGALKPLNCPSLTPTETRQIVYSILTDSQRHRFEEDYELDLSFGIKGLSRFRVNIYMQRGAVAAAFRVIPYKIMSFEELGLPPIVKELA
ncbi:MAG: type IV pili twitching motility protein PilT, partial [Deltaproteobacteria bacterium]|nr:type IV pili twitching motility protein PilT [Deltaproteobacteria bacterium]